MTTPIWQPQQKLGETTLEIAKIRRDGGTQPRDKVDESTAREYGEAMKVNGINAFPPVTIYYDGTDYWLADGFHRVLGAELFNIQHIRADIRQGTRREAVLHSAGANATHGLRRMNADKRRAVMTLLNDAEWRQWSDREIARKCGVSQPFVSNLRTELSDNGYQMDTRKVERNGTTYTMNTASVGKKDRYCPNCGQHTNWSTTFSPSHVRCLKCNMDFPKEICPIVVEKPEEPIPAGTVDSEGYPIDASDNTDHEAEAAARAVALASILGEEPLAVEQQDDTPAPAPDLSVSTKRFQVYEHEAGQTRLVDQATSSAQAVDLATLLQRKADQEGRYVYYTVWDKYYFRGTRPVVTTTPAARPAGAQTPYQPGQRAICHQCESHYARRTDDATYTDWQPTDNPQIWRCPQGHRVADSLMDILVDIPSEDQPFIRPREQWNPHKDGYCPACQELHRHWIDSGEFDNEGILWICLRCSAKLTQAAMRRDYEVKQVEAMEAEIDEEPASTPLWEDMWYPIQHPDKRIYNDPFASQQDGAADPRYAGHAIQLGKLIIDGIKRGLNYASYQIVAPLPMPEDDDQDDEKVDAYAHLNIALKDYLPRLKLHSKPAARRVLSIGRDYSTQAAKEAALACLDVIKTEDKTIQALKEARDEINRLRHALKVR